ncbi:hypothetical protein MaudMau93_006234 [Microsporum audouinii]
MSRGGWCLEFTLTLARPGQFNHVQNGSRVTKGPDRIFYQEVAQGSTGGQSDQDWSGVDGGGRVPNQSLLGLCVDNAVAHTVHSAAREEWSVRGSATRNASRHLHAFFFFGLHAAGGWSVRGNAADAASRQTPEAARGRFTCGSAATAASRRRNRYGGAMVSLVVAQQRCIETPEISVCGRLVAGCERGGMAGAQP